MRLQTTTLPLPRSPRGGRREREYVPSREILSWGPYTTDLSAPLAEQTPYQIARRVAERKLAPADLAFVAVRLPMLLLSMVTPRRWDAGVAALLWRASRIGGRGTAKRVVMLKERRAALGIETPSGEGPADEYLRRRWEAYWASFRALSRRGWETRVDWEGEEHLIRGLESGRGVILWFCSFCQSLIMMRALHERGYRVAHLSRIAHGAPSNSLVGMTVLAGFARRAENRYLAERIVIDRSLTPRGMRRIERLLADNYCLTVRGDQEATPGLTATLFGKSVCLAPGAPSLAWKTGATLLTIGLYRKGFGRYGLQVDPPIEVNRTADRKTAVRRAAAVFTERLERRVELHPDDWDGWERSQGFWLAG